MKEIPLRARKYNGLVALVDDEDAWLGEVLVFSPIRQSKISYDKFYAVHWFADLDGNWRALLLHRLVICAMPGTLVDHKNGDTLDCRRGNLRQCSHSQNMANRIKSGKFSSQFLGVSFESKWKKWRAHVSSNGKRYRSSGFDNEVDAAKKYNEMATALHGEFARLNVI